MSYEPEYVRGAKTASAPKAARKVSFSPYNHDNDQINVLQAAHYRACEELCISKTDQVGRERVASILMAFAKCGHIDVGSRISSPQGKSGLASQHDACKRRE